MTTVLSVDLGASGGKMISHSFDGSKLMIEEIHRFPNEIIHENGGLRWDFSSLLGRIYEGIRKAQEDTRKGLAGLGIDTWGVDFGILDKEGSLAANPYSYRDDRTVSIMDRSLAGMDAYTLFKKTGNEVAAINTIFQLLAIKEHEPELLEEAKGILLMPNLFNYFLTGKAVNEFTIASTAQLLNSGSPEWASGLIDEVFGRTLPLAEVSMPHQILGSLKTDLGSRENIRETPVILIPGHDTACALSALPIESENAYFMSVGTWALIGIELDRPLLSQEAFEGGFTNEGTSEGTCRFQKNAMGFWILQQLRKEWESQGIPVDFEKEHSLLEASDFSRMHIDPDDGQFFHPPSMEEAIHTYCRRTGQPAPATQQEMLRAVVESMALKYAHTIGKMEKMTGKRADRIHLGGGGIRNRRLCQFIADASGKEVAAGPAEASSIGNGLSQLRALGEIGSLKEGRTIVRDSFLLEKYEPEQSEGWREAASRFSEILANGEREMTR